MVSCAVAVEGLPDGKATFRLVVPDLSKKGVSAINGALTMPSKTGSRAVLTVTRAFKSVKVTAASRSDSPTPVYNLTFPRDAAFEQIVQGDSSTLVSICSFSLSSRTNTLELMPSESNAAAIKASLKNCSIPIIELNRIIGIKAS